MKYFFIVSLWEPREAAVTYKNGAITLAKIIGSGPLFEYLRDFDSYKMYDVHKDEANMKVLQCKRDLVPGCQIN